MSTPPLPHPRDELYACNPHLRPRTSFWRRAGWFLPGFTLATVACPVGIILLVSRRRQP